LRQFFSDDVQSSDDERFHQFRKSSEDDMDTGINTRYYCFV
jgi:hypothetical protein